MAPRLHCPLRNPVALVHQPAEGSFHDRAERQDSEARTSVRMLDSCTGQLLAQSSARCAIFSTVLARTGRTTTRTDKGGCQFWQFIPGQTSAAAADYSRGEPPVGLFKSVVDSRGQRSVLACGLCPSTSSPCRKFALFFNKCVAQLCRRR